jgi:hypothetical protein
VQAAPTRSHNPKHGEYDLCGKCASEYDARPLDVIDHPATTGQDHLDMDGVANAGALPGLRTTGTVDRNRTQQSR